MSQKQTAPHRLLLALCSSLGCAVALSQCVARSDTPLIPITEDDAGPQKPIRLDAGDDEDDIMALPDASPHAVLSVEPSTGPFNGGQIALVRGNGFTSKVRVWFGEEEVGEGDVLPIDPGRVQVVVPPGRAGFVDVTTQNGEDESTRASLAEAYAYTAFYAEPNAGPTSGGVEIRLIGSETEWDEDTEVLVDRNPCTDVTVQTPTELTCVTPPGTPGSKAVEVVTDSGSASVLDAFTYTDSQTDARGGLSGDRLDGDLEVIALDAFAGKGIPGAMVILSDASVAQAPDELDVHSTGKDGTVSIDGVDEPVTVTVAAPCLQPVTFVDVPVDTVTVYLRPVITPSCGSDDEIPGSGRGASERGQVQGELVWQSLDESSRDGWTNVPAPKGSERHVAYIYRLVSDPRMEFNLRSYVATVTPSVGGEAGFAFSFSSLPGNYTLYALAGIEDPTQSPPSFTAYAMGVLRGVAARPDASTSKVFLPVDIPLDHGLTVGVQAPTPTDRGPDRLWTNVAIRVQEDGYALLPGAQKVDLLPLPSQKSVEFVGIPPLIGSLTGAEYVLSAMAATGPSALAPRSVVGSFATRDSGGITLSRFVEIPRLLAPEQNETWSGTELELEVAPGGRSIELTLIELESGLGLSTWRIAVPGTMSTLYLPDLRALNPEAALLSGSLSAVLSLAHIEDFDYGGISYRQLSTSGWDAFASDVYFLAY